MSHRRANPKRREARRAADRQWCDLQLTLLRVEFGFTADQVALLRSAYTTKGHMRQWISSHMRVNDLRHYAPKPELHTWYLNAALNSLRHIIRKPEQVRP